MLRPVRYSCPPGVERRAQCVDLVDHVDLARLPMRRTACGAEEGTHGA
ncbi:MAG TPA: hypothetical protein VEL07_19835 [Planctomycetota bacterium]|nr:hypothetical protein [Planctomycetota bacterium]